MKRRGFLLIELVVAGVLLLALTTLCVKYFAVTATQRQALNQRQTAIIRSIQYHGTAHRRKLERFDARNTCQNIAFARDTICFARR